MKTLLILLNLLSAALVFPAMHVTHYFYEQRGVDMYIALDRPGFIDREQIKHAYGSDAASARTAIPHIYFSKAFPAYYIGIPCIFAFLLNAFLIAIFWKRTNTAEQGAAANP